MMPPSYDGIAEWYDQSVRVAGSLAARVADHLLELCGEAAGLRVCDLACGQGLVARRLARRGARVTGIDLSTRLLEIARREEQAEPLGIEYRSGDAQALDEIPDATFDGVVCSLALMDIPDLGATFRSVRRVLKPVGWFVISITHPCFQLPAPDAGDARGAPAREERLTYFAECFWHSDHPHGVRGQVGAYHRSLGRYLNALSDAGFLLERLVEPEGPGLTSRRSPSDPEAPKFLIARCRRG